MKSEAEIRRALEGVARCVLAECLQGDGVLEGPTAAAMYAAMGLRWAIGEPAADERETIMFRLLDSMNAINDAARN